MVRLLLLSVLLACFAAATLAATYRRYDHWSNDGYWYALAMLRDMGESPRRARSEAQAFYLRQPVARSPRVRWYIADDDPNIVRPVEAVFRGRPLFPFLSSLLFRREGFAAPVRVSNLAFVAATIALFLLLAGEVQPWLAALGAALLPLVHTVRWLGAADFTDMFALFVWIAMLAALGAAVHRRAIWPLVALAAGTVALGATRPAIYLPLGAAAGLATWAWPHRGHVRLAVWPAMVAILSGVAIWAILAAAWHAPGIAAELRYDYSEHFLFTPHPPPFTVWYRQAVHGEIAALLRYHLLLPPTLLALTISAVGFIVRRASAMAAASLGATAAVLATVFVNPIPLQLTRTVCVPLYPIVILGVVYAAKAALDLRAMRSSATNARVGES